MKKKGGLGKFFLKKFSRLQKKKSTQKIFRRQLSLSQMHLSIEKKKQDFAVTVVPLPTPILSPVLAPSLPVPLPVSVESSAFSLSIREFLKPNDHLRQSIEAFLLDQRSPHTRRAYSKDLKRLVKFLHSRNHSENCEKINRTLLIAYKDSLVSEGLEHTTVDRHLATLRSFFKWLVDDGILDKSPADGVRFLNPKRISRTIGFSDEEVKKILSLPNLHSKTGALHYAILMVLFYCGLRRSEVCALRTVNIGVERNQNVLRLRGKGNSERMLVMVPAVYNAIKYYFYITRRSFDSADTFLFAPLKNNRTGEIKKPLDPSMIFYVVTKYARLAGISNRVSPHSCRATAISNARDHHVPDRAIQEFAGWASPDMITRYDKRKTSVEDSAAHSITYGSEERTFPELSSLSPQSELK